MMPLPSNAAAMPPSAKPPSEIVTSVALVFFGANSVIRAITLGITPPSPRPATKRSAENVTASCDRPAAAVKTLNSATLAAMARRRPMRSATAPSTTAPNIMPKVAALIMKPAVVAETPMSFMMSGSAMPTTARS